MVDPEVNGRNDFATGIGYGSYSSGHYTCIMSDLTYIPITVLISCRQGDTAYSMYSNAHNWN